MARPHQLPSDTPDFVGRLAELADLRTYLLGRQSPERGRSRAVLVTGAAGVGKTAFAVHLGHVLKRHFADGQLFVRLRGTDRAGLPPADALELCLRALGVSSESMPSSQAKRAALYQALLKGRSVLVIIDDAFDDGQAKLLIPAEPGCAAIITSRSSLSDPQIGRVLELQPFSEPDALEFLTRYIGADRVAAEPVAARGLVRSSGYLPLAIQAIAALSGAALSPGFAVSLGVLSGQLAEGPIHRQQDKSPTAWLESALRLGYEKLDPPAANLVRLIAQLNLPEIDAQIAAVLLDSTPERTAETIRQLASIGLLQAVNFASPRFRMHDVMRDQARELGDQTYDSAAPHLAMQRLLHWYVDNLRAATAVFRSPSAALAATAGSSADAEPRPERQPEETGTRGDGTARGWSATQPQNASAWPGGLEEALPWLERERANVVALAAEGNKQGWPELVAELAAASAVFFDARAYWDDALAIHGRARTAAITAGNRHLEATALANLGTAYFSLGKIEEAEAAYRASLAKADDSSDRPIAGRAAAGMGRVLANSGRDAEAVDFFRRALSTAGELKQHDQAGRLHRYLGGIFDRQRDVDKALEHYNASLSIAQQQQDPYLEGAALTDLGSLARQAGEMETAQDFYMKALGVARTVADRESEASVSILLAILGR